MSCDATTVTVASPAPARGADLRRLALALAARLAPMLDTHTAWSLTFTVRQPADTANDRAAERAEVERGIAHCLATVGKHRGAGVLLALDRRPNGSWHAHGVAFVPKRSHADPAAVLVRSWRNAWPRAKHGAPTERPAPDARSVEPFTRFAVLWRAAQHALDPKHSRKPGGVPHPVPPIVERVHVAGTLAPVWGEIAPALGVPGMEPPSRASDGRKAPPQTVTRVPKGHCLRCAKPLAPRRPRADRRRHLHCAPATSEAVRRAVKRARDRQSANGWRGMLDPDPDAVRPWFRVFERMRYPDAVALRQAVAAARDGLPPASMLAPLAPPPTAREAHKAVGPAARGAVRRTARQRVCAACASPLPADARPNRRTCGDACRAALARRRARAHDERNTAMPPMHTNAVATPAPRTALAVVPSHRSAGPAVAALLPFTRAVLDRANALARIGGAELLADGFTVHEITRALPRLLARTPRRAA